MARTKRLTLGAVVDALAGVLRADYKSVDAKGPIGNQLALNQVQALPRWRLLTERAIYWPA
jgi:hypothetical protein